MKTAVLDTGAELGAGDLFGRTVLSPLISHSPGHRHRLERLWTKVRTRRLRRRDERPNDKIVLMQMHKCCSPGTVRPDSRPSVLDTKGRDSAGYDAVEEERVKYGATSDYEPQWSVAYGIWWATGGQLRLHILQPIALPGQGR
jgi:hypothetical protein